MTKHKPASLWLSHDTQAAQWTWGRVGAGPLGWDWGMEIHTIWHQYWLLGGQARARTQAQPSAFCLVLSLHAPSIRGEVGVQKREQD